MDSLGNDEFLKAAMSDIGGHQQLQAAVCLEGIRQTIAISTLKTYVIDTYSEKVALATHEFIDVAFSCAAEASIVCLESEGIGAQPEPTNWVASAQPDTLWTEAGQLTIGNAATQSRAEQEPDKELYDRLQAAIDDAKHPVDLSNINIKFQKGTFDFDDYISQMRLMNAIGGLPELMRFIPGMDKIPSEILAEGESRLQMFASMIDVMSIEERQDPSLLINSSARRERIAAASGLTDKDVYLWIMDFVKMRGFMQRSTRGRQ